MSDHQQYVDILPFYAAGQLSETECAALEAHLLDCASCREELRQWRQISAAVTQSNLALVAPPDLADKALQSLHQRSLTGMLQHTWQLLRVQARLVVPELWPAAAIVMVIGVLAAWIAQKQEVIYFLAPMVAAGCLAVISGPDHDPAVELTFSTPTPQAVILMARMTLVTAFNLILALAASAFVLPIVPAELLSGLMLSWLGPLLFLSALALLLSQWMGAGNALVVAYSLWLLRFIPFPPPGVVISSPVVESVLAAYQQFWGSTPLLLGLGVLLLGVAFWSANHNPGLNSQSAG